VGGYSYGRVLILYMYVGCVLMCDLYILISYYVEDWIVCINVCIV
jgi:hypothetical protein